MSVLLLIMNFVMTFVITVAVNPSGSTDYYVMMKVIINNRTDAFDQFEINLFFTNDRKSSEGTKLSQNARNLCVFLDNEN